jgi:hypothetical protein
VGRLIAFFEEYTDALLRDVKRVFLSDESSNSHPSWLNDYLPTDIRVSDDHTETDDLMKYIAYCLQPAVRMNFTVYNLNADENLSTVILRAIYRGITYVDVHTRHITRNGI